MQGIINIPVLDRDEARFATATKTMLETKDFIDIKMQEETRYKKPIGIYWAQVFSNYILEILLMIKYGYIEFHLY